jgi:tryptophan synthase beta chain
VLQDNGQVAETHSVSAMHPGVGPEHAFLKDIGRAGTSTSPTRKRWPPFITCAAPGASFNALDPPRGLQ